MSTDRKRIVEVRLVVVVLVDAPSPVSRERWPPQASHHPPPPSSEVVSNLESAPYVESVIVSPLWIAKEESMQIKFTPNEKGHPAGKLADAELHFTDGPLEGLKLIGFAIWERRGGSGRNVTFPARQYSLNGERRSFALLRPVVDTTAQNRIRELILEAYTTFEGESST